MNVSVDSLLKNLVVYLCALIVACPTDAAIRNLRTYSKLVGVCADFEKRYTNVSLRFCAKDTDRGETFYYISIDLVTKDVGQELEGGRLEITQTRSKQKNFLRFDSRSETLVHSHPPSFVKSYMVELPWVYIKHLREGIPIAISFRSKGITYYYGFSPEEINEIRMVSLFG